MTIDDDNSIYVGGLPYDCSEETVRRAFDLYGAVVAIKIHNDRDVGGKCYGFVTFTNPRSAIDAINDMDGREIGGRKVRVNEVKSKDGGRSNFGHGNARRDTDRAMDLDRDRDRGRERGNFHDRERYRDRNMGRSRDRDPLPDRAIEDDRPRGHDRSRDPLFDRDRVQSRDRKHIEKEVSRKHDRDKEHSEQEVNRKHDRDWVRDYDVEEDQNREVDRDDDHDRRDRDKDQLSKSRTGSHFYDRRSREMSSTSSDDYEDEVKEQLELSIERREELQKEISQIDAKFEKKQQLVVDLEKKSQKLEDALASAKKISAQRRMQMSKFQRYILQVKDYSEKLKNSEQGLQSLVDSMMADIDDDTEDAMIWDDVDM